MPKTTMDDSLTYSIIGCAMNVHNFLGNGFQEVIYQRALEIEFKNAQLNYERELVMPLYYKEIPVGKRRVDFLVENKVLIELKAVIDLQDVHLAQGLNYLSAYKIQKGLLINFGATSLQVKRLFKKH